MEEKKTDIEKILKERAKLDSILQTEFSKKIAVMFTDIKGSTSFYEARGDIDGRVMVHRHNEIVLPVIEENGGVLIKTIGDATMSVYEQPGNAVKAAIQIQQRLKEYNKDRNDREQIHVRVGVNFGTGLVEEKDVFGDVVNVASRVEALADAGQIMITEDLYREVKNNDEFTFRFVDHIEVKGKKDPVKVFRTIWHEEELYLGRTRTLPDPAMKKERVFVLETSASGHRLKVSGFERSEGEERPVKGYEDVKFNEARIRDYTKGIISLLNRANRRGKIGNDLLVKLKEYGRLLFDELIPLQLKEKLMKTEEKHLMISIDDKLVHIPWELLYDGKDFLCQRFSIGRTVSTKQPVAITARAIGRPLKMHILADPKGDLDNSYQEGVVIKDDFGRLDDWIDVSLKTTDIKTDYVKAKIRNFDIVHYAGHADHNAVTPEDSGWLLSDGKLSAGDINKLTGVLPMPSLVFSNACQSGQTDQWRLGEDCEDRIFGLANAFLLSGVQHYIGTFWEIPDEAGSYFAVHFYRNLVKGITIGEAVRAARNALIEKYGEDTIVWAGYMLYGDPTSRYLGVEAEIKPKKVTDKTREKEELVAPALRQTETIHFPEAKKERDSRGIYGKRTLVLTLSLITVLLFAGLAFFNTRGKIGSTDSGKIAGPPDGNRTSQGTSLKRVDELVASLAKDYREGRFNKAKGSHDNLPPTLLFTGIRFLGAEGRSDEVEVKRLIELLTQSLLSEKGVNIVEREILDKLLEELKLSASELADPSTSLKLGRILSARVIVTGSIIAGKDGQTIMLRLIDTETTAIRKTVSAEAPKKEIDRETVNEISGKIIDWIRTDFPAAGMKAGG